MLPYTTYLIDLDGVVYRGEELLPGAKEFVAWLDASHKKYLFLTNNSANFDGLSRLEDLIKLIGPPKWPWLVDNNLAAQGKAIYEAKDEPAILGAVDQFFEELLAQTVAAAS